jgi:hypothetical protein
MIKRYKDFGEVAEEIREGTHPIVYKFRTWEDNYHKRIITNREAWFAHPHSLNDPYDVRPPYNFVIGDIDWDKARYKIRQAGKIFEPDLTDQELESEVELRIEDIQTDPVAYFQRTRGEYILDKSNYDRIGVFSCCTSSENEPMWAYYGNNHYGFAVGFNTVELSRALQCTVGYVNYDDTPVNYYILGDNRGLMENEIFQKATHWKAEEELRFITAGIGLIRERASEFPVQAVSEIVFGLNTSQQAQEEIMVAAAKSLPGIPFYQIKTRPDSYGFEKVRMG